MKKWIKMDSNSSPSACQASILAIEPCLLGELGLWSLASLQSTPQPLTCIDSSMAGALAFYLEVMDSNPAYVPPLDSYTPPQMVTENQSCSWPFSPWTECTWILYQSTICNNDLWKFILLCFTLRNIPYSEHSDNYWISTNYLTWIVIQLVCLIYTKLSWTI